MEERASCCSAFAKELARHGASIAILNRTLSKAEVVANEIISKGGKAIAVMCNVLHKDNLIQAANIVKQELGPCNILINGAGGNHPQGSTTKETLELEDLKICITKMNNNIF